MNSRLNMVLLLELTNFMEQQNDVTSNSGEELVGHVAWLR